MSIKTVREIKRHILALIEEYSTNATKANTLIEEYLNVNYSDDADINTKLIPIINLQYQFLANQEGIVKTKDIEIKDNTINPYRYTGYSLLDSWKILNVEILESDIESIDYKYMNQKLYVKNNFYGVIEVDYYVYPTDLTTIPNDEVDDFEIELSPNAAVALCYMVAGDILITDSSANYQAFSQKASQVLQALDSDNSNTIGIVEQIDLRSM